MKEISSLQNPLVKQILLLQSKSRERRKTGLFIIEGQREIQLAIDSDYELQTLLIEENKYKEGTDLFLEKNLGGTNFIKVTSNVYGKLAYRQNTEGLLAIARAHDHTLENLVIEQKNPLLLIAEAPEKPGNIGALLRTADAAGVDAVIIANPKTDLYNPNIIRSSVGCVFTNTVVMGSTNDIISFLKEKEIPLYAASLEASACYSNIDFREAAAIVVGTEATGLEQEWLLSSKQNIIIPMQGKIDSMNVSVAAAIIIFEACRQRSFE
ncbi:TrmH family RNA methyltransferase [Ascidiimonas sp. W6]|uniref:TrmH family RNA methyltransferase n=1 Tax=Ascidiimonas meishanensis TaxID=3128903 RepID=UPI0030EBA061